MQWPCRFFAPKNWNLILARYGMSRCSGRTRQFSKVLLCNLNCWRETVRDMKFALWVGGLRSLQPKNSRYSDQCTHYKVVCVRVSCDHSPKVERVQQPSTSHKKLNRCLSASTRFMNFFGRVLLWQLVIFLDQALFGTTCPKEHVGKNSSVVRQVHVRACQLTRSGQLLSCNMEMKVLLSPTASVRPPVIF